MTGARWLLLPAMALACSGASAFEGASPVPWAPAEFLRSAAQLEAPEVPAGRPVPSPEAPPSPRAFTLPRTFSMFELNRGMLPGTEFRLRSSDDQDLGRVYPRIISLRKGFSKMLGLRPRLSILLEDARGNRIAEATAQFFSLSYKVHVEDAQGKSIGSFSGRFWQERADKWFFEGQLHNYYTRYDLFGPDGALIAVCEKTQTPAIKFIVKRELDDADHEALAEIRSANGWAFNIHHPEAVDPRLLVMIPAFKSYVNKEMWNRRLREGRP